MKYLYQLNDAKWCKITVKFYFLSVGFTPLRVTTRISIVSQFIKYLMKKSRLFKLTMLEKRTFLLVACHHNELRTLYFFFSSFFFIYDSILSDVRYITDRLSPQQIYGHKSTENNCFALCHKFHQENKPHAPEWDRK